MKGYKKGSTLEDRLEVARDLEYDKKFPSVFKRMESTKSEAEFMRLMAWCRTHL